MGRKEELIKKVQRLRNELEYIRDIGTAAHIDHGKCVAPHTRICLADNILTAEELFELCKARGKLTIHTENELIYDCGTAGLQVFSLNKETGKIEKKQIKYAWKLKNKDQLIKIKLKNGLALSTTTEHKYLVYDGTGFVEKT
ncbi:MAG: intein-containing elongation factor EF-2, partial [Candidatus Thermoplasmatota archaeon]